RVEAPDEARPHGARRDLARAVPIGLVVRPPQGQVHALAEARLPLGEEVEALVAVRMGERTVAPVVLERDERLQGIARRREEGQVALGGERAAGGLGVVLVDRIAALVLADDEAGYQTQYVGRPALGTKLEVATGDEDLRGRRDGRRRRYDDRRQSRFLRARRCLLSRRGRRLRRRRGRQRHAG